MSVNDDWLADVLTAQWVAGTHVAYMLSDASLFDPATDTFLSDVPALDRTAGPITVTNKGADGPYATADPVQFEPAEGVTSGWMIVVEDTGVEATSRIVVSYDRRLDGLPLDDTGDGFVLELSWPSSRWFRV